MTRKPFMEDTRLLERVLLLATMGWPAHLLAAYAGTAKLSVRIGK